MSFTFGNPTGAPAFSFGSGSAAPAPATAPATSAFTFGAPPATTTPGAGAFSFGAGAAKADAATPSSGFGGFTGFGAPAAGGFGAPVAGGFGAPAAAAAATAPAAASTSSFGFAIPATPAAAPSAFGAAPAGFGAPAPAPVAAAAPAATTGFGGFGAFGAPVSTAANEPAVGGAFTGFGVTPAAAVVAPTTAAAPTTFGTGPAPASVTTAPAASSFSFLAPTPAADSAAAPAAAAPSSFSAFYLPSAAAPITAPVDAAAPAPQAFSFGAPVVAPAAAAATDVLAPASSSTPSPTPAQSVPVIPIVKPSAEFRTDTLDGIIKKWYSELNDDIQEYQMQVQKVAAWDNQLRENQKAAVLLAESVHRLFENQEQLRRDCDTIEAYQEDLHADLLLIEQNVQREMLSMPKDQSEDDVGREEMYLMAEEIDQHLNTMESSLKKVVTDYNKQRGAGDSGSGSVFSQVASKNPSAKIVEVLNSHHDTLASLDSRSRQLQKEMLALSRDLKLAPTPKFGDREE